MLSLSIWFYTERFVMYVHGCGGDWSESLRVASHDDSASAELLVSEARSPVGQGLPIYLKCAFRVSWVYDCMGLICVNCQLSLAFELHGKRPATRKLGRAFEQFERGCFGDPWAPLDGVGRCMQKCAFGCQLHLLLDQSQSCPISVVVGLC